MNSRLGRGVDICLTSNCFELAPQCAHGPTLLFERYIAGSATPRRYYACSACRNSKECTFFRWADESGSKKDEFNQLKVSTFSSRKKDFERLKSMRELPKSSRNFCQTCSILLMTEELTAHEGHDIKTGLSKQDLRRPTRLLLPLSDNHNNAQYLFAKSTTDFFIELIKKLGKCKVLCIGTPRLFEELKAYNASVVNKSDKLQCLLLDLDHRLLQFFSPRQMCRYNMFNQHFFDGDKARNIYLDFLRRSSPVVANDNDEDFIVVLDPPFGGLVDLLTFTLKSISADYRSVNGIESCKSLVPVIWIFPYFMESRIATALSTMSMIDYQVNYDNHRNFRQSSDGGTKSGSPVRFFTNLDPARVVLPEEEGYWYCCRCSRYSSSSNRHCAQCNSCTTKAGPTYVHCSKCERCVKPTWQHCSKCKSCELPGRHTRFLKRTGCHVCGEEGHKRLRCPMRADSGQLGTITVESKTTKRKRKPCDHSLRRTKTKIKPLSVKRSS